jgi:hypothetical protein
VSCDEIFELWLVNIPFTQPNGGCAKEGLKKDGYRPPVCDSGSDGDESRLEAIASENSQFFFVDVNLANDKGVSEDSGEPRGRSGCYG